MPYPQLDRSQVRMQPLSRRQNKKVIERDAVSPDAAPSGLSPAARIVVDETAGRVRLARAAGRPVMMAFGAHAIKNGLAPVLIRLLENGWVTLLATNGAGIIHDWEFAFQGMSSEDVRGGIERGQFGNWHETGFFINLAIAVGAHEGMGYGESVGALIERERLVVPAADELAALCRERLADDPAGAAAAADLAAAIRRNGVPAGAMAVPHPWKRFSVQAAAFRLGVPFTGHPMFGHDIIYTHPMNTGAAVGRAAERDFLAFARQVRELAGGVYISIGSAVMSPMVFEKSLSMAQNLALQGGGAIRDHYLAVVDLQPGTWDWSAGEPPESRPEYYMRFNKTFSRCGGVLRYAAADNRDFLLALWQALGPRVAT